MASIDSISNLPDSLLLHIMSFLDSQKAVQTCVLSKRWKNLWASLQCLHLDQSKLKTTSKLKGERFTYYVNTLLILRDTSDLQKFHLRCSYNDDSIMSWILYAIKCNAKVIKIKIKIDVMDYKRLPEFMFNSASLEELNLCIYNIDKGIGLRAINLPRLKKLKLCVRSDDSDILNKLALGCPALEDLYLIDCIMNIRVVSFPKLKYLKIRSWKEDMFVESIRAPNLVSLVLVGLAEPYGEISFEKMPSLMNATISLWSRSCYSFDAEKCNLLRAVANVQKLDLSGKTIQALFQIDFPRCPTFFNLTTMLLCHFCMICHSNEVGDILKHTPNLKKLTLCKNNDDKHECDMEANQGRSNSVKNALFQCKNLDEIEVELKFINVGTKQLVNTLVESLAELKTTHLILSFHRIDYNSPSSARLHRFCLSMIQGKHVLTLLRGNKFIVWSK